MKTDWRARHSWALVFLLPILFWEIAVLWTGSYPSNECAAGYGADHGACDYVGLVINPFRPLARFVELHDKLFVALGTVGLVIFTATLWFATRRLVAGADDTARRQLRAYVGIHHADIELRLLHMQASEFIIRLNFRNSGSTPAYRFRTWGWAGVEDDKAFIFPDLIPVNPASILFSESSVNVTHIMRPPAAVTQDIRNGAVRMAVWGRADFEDAFGKPRFFIFRMISGDIDPGSGRYALSPHGEGYEAN